MRLESSSRALPNPQSEIPNPQLLKELVNRRRVERQTGGPLKEDGRLVLLAIEPKFVAHEEQEAVIVGILLNRLRKLRKLLIEPAGAVAVEGDRASGFDQQLTQL